MAFTFRNTGQFKKDLKLIQKRSSNDFEELRDFIKNILINGSKNIPKEYLPHQLKGTFKNSWECHVLNDLLIIWKEDVINDEITLVRTGSHSDLFK